MRLVSLSCSNTEIVCALGCADYLVGVDNDSDYPPDSLKQLARVGRDLDIDVEKVKALQPDLVLASLTVPGHEKVIENLVRADLNYIALEPIFFQDVYRDIRDIANRLGAEQAAEKLIAKMQQTIPTKTDLSVSDRPSMLVQWWPNPVIAPGRLSWVNDLINLAGGRNPLAAGEYKSSPLEDSQVADLDPDAVVISWCGVREEKYRPELIYRNKAFAGMRAVRNKQIYSISEAYLGRPGPRLVEGFRRLRGVLAGLLD